MERLKQLTAMLTKANRLSDLVKFIQLRSSNFNKVKSLDFGVIRISPSDNVARIKEQFIPLARSTVIRKLSQNPDLVGSSNLTVFEEFNKYLEACIYNRNHFFLKEVQASYEHLNPDVEVASGGVKQALARRQVLDEEFWLVQKLSRMMELGNFSELNRTELGKLLHCEGGFNTLQVWVDGAQYELLKVWILGREDVRVAGRMRGLLDGLGLRLGLGIRAALGGRVNPFRVGHTYKRVVVATRLHNANKIELKMFKELSEGQLIHTIPQVMMKHSATDNSILFWTGVLLASGWLVHSVLPMPALESGLLNSTHHLATSLAMLSAAVGLFHWNVIQSKKTSYWKWRSDLNYRSIIANNRGVISVLADRVQDEIFKESLLAYVHVLAQPGGSGGGISQRELEAQVRQWAIANCEGTFRNASANLYVDLTEAITLLRQLDVVQLDQASQLLTAKPFESSAATLSAEFGASNLSVDLDGNTIIRNDDLHKLPDEPITEGYEKIRRVASEDK